MNVHSDLWAIPFLVFLWPLKMRILWLLHLCWLWMINWLEMCNHPELAAIFFFVYVIYEFCKPRSLRYHKCRWIVIFFLLQFRATFLFKCNFTPVLFLRFPLTHHHVTSTTATPPIICFSAANWDHRDVFVPSSAKIHPLFIEKNP